MLEQITTAVHRSRDTLAADMIGAAALMVALLGGLFLPGLI
jgi:hypothetical protein